MAGFRRSRGTLDNIYVLNYMVSRELQRKEGGEYAFFVNLRAAFDSVDRRRLWKAIIEKEMSKKLRKRLREIYGEIVSKVKAGGGRLEGNCGRL